MADTPDSTTPDFAQTTIDANTAAVAVQNFSDTTTSSIDSLRNFGTFVGNAGAALKGMTDNLKLAADHMQNSHVMMQRSADLLGVMGNAALGASKMFADGFQDTSGIQSFGSQIDGLVDTASRAFKPIDALNAVAKSFGLGFAAKATDDVKKVASTISSLVKATLEGPDAALKFQNSFLQMSAVSGNLGNVFNQTGGHLQNLNDLLQTQGQMLSKAAEATNTDVKTTTEYYTALGKIPGYLNGQVAATDEAGTHLNALTAAMRLAHGIGISESEMMGELTVAFNNYGVGVQKAMEFTARISDLSQKYGVQLSDVTGFMNRSAESFKFLGENIDSTAGIFESYFSRLRSTGLSSQAATEMTNNLTDSIGKMSIAQKAFLSGQTGGPGGLMGAIQIEKDIRDGKAQDVMKRVETALKQQFGRIVTQQEAATSEQAAAQFVKQRMFVQQGPFGGLARDEGQATRLLEAFGKPGGVSQVDAQKLLRDDIKKGSDVEQKSYTQLTQVNARLEAIKMLSGITALGVTQRATTPGAGGDLQRQLLGGIKDSINLGRDATTAGNKSTQDRSATYMTQGVQGLYQVMNHLGDTAGAMGKEVKTLTTSRETVARSQADAYNKAMVDVHRSATVGGAAHMSANTTPKIKDTAMVDQWMAESKKPKPPPPPQNIVVTMTSVCPDCHKKFTTNQQQKSINNAPQLNPDSLGGAGF